jgi:hypothetical protein
VRRLLCALVLVAVICVAAAIVVLDIRLEIIEVVEPGYSGDQEYPLRGTQPEEIEC